MTSPHNGNRASHRSVRIAVVAAALGVAACFAAAFTFVGEQPAQAGDPAIEGTR